MLNVVKKIIQQSKYNFKYIDLGGGMGINYEDKKKQLNLKKYCLNIKKFLKKYNSKIIFVLIFFKKDFINLLYFE